MTDATTTSAAPPSGASAAERFGQPPVAPLQRLGATPAAKPWLATLGEDHERAASRLARGSETLARVVPTAATPDAEASGTTQAKTDGDAEGVTQLHYNAGVRTPPEAAPIGQVACVIPRQVSFKGTARYNGDVLLEGRFEGALTVENGKMNVAATATHIGEITAPNIRVEGKVDGTVNVGAGLASFGPRSSCSGAIHYGRISIEEGAEIEATMKRVSAAA